MSSPVNQVFQTTQSVLNKSRQDKFQLVLTLPAILRTVNNTDQLSRTSKLLNLDSLQYSVHGSVVPQSNIAPVEIGYAGQTTKVTSLTRDSYDPVTVNFVVDNLFNNWWVLWYWLNVINDSEQSIYNATNLSPTDHFYGQDTYKTQITIFGLDEYNNRTIQFDYKYAFITGIGGIDYDYQNPSQIESTFTFAFGQLTSQLLTPPS